MTGRDEGRDRPGPPCADGLVRERLVRRLDPVLSARLGLVVAPHGTGKTTLLAHWAARRTEPLVWHQVSSWDVHPERLLARLAGDVAALLEAPAPRSTADLASMVAGSGLPLCLVLDDVHLLVGTPAETELERLLLLSPPNVHLVLAGRRAPSFNLARPEFSRTVLVDGDDLRFRAGEAHALFRDVYGRPLRAAQLLDLVRTTDGWAAGLHLFHLHAMQRSPVERDRSACGAGPDYARGYLRQHVLADLSDPETELLQIASLFDVVTPRHCDALLGVPGAASPVLQELGRRSLLTEDDVVGGLQMPAVLRRFVADELRATTDHDRYASLRGRAVTLLERDGALGNALGLLATDGRWTDARRLLERSGSAAYAPGTCTWAARLPSSGRSADESWFELAEARRLFDDGRFAAARAAACRVLARTEDPVSVAIATDIRDRATVWCATGGAVPRVPSPQPDVPLRAAVRSDPVAVVRALGPDPRDEDLLAAGIARLLTGDRRTALPMLRRCAQRLDRDRPCALAAQLVLALFEVEEANAVTDPSTAELESVHRRARSGGFSWLARLTDGMLAALSGNDSGAELAEAVVRDCERRGDDWGAALLHAVTVLAGARIGGPTEETVAVLAGRFRALDAEVLAAWATSLTARPARACGLSPAAPALTGGGSAAPGGAAVAVTCFGGLTVRLDGVPVDLAGVRPRVRTLLRLLALHAGQPVHRDRLADMLWADLEGPRALHNLQVGISALRRLLQEQGGDGQNPVVRQGDSYALYPGPDSWFDLAEFDRLLHEAEQAHRRGHRAQREAALQAAVELYSGDLLPEEGPAEWLVELRDRYRLRAAQAAGALARARTALGRREDAIAAAACSVEINPWSDDSWRVLIELLLDSGQLAEAERTRRRYRDMLHSLGIVSGPG